jgi:hypothetical protein
MKKRTPRGFAVYGEYKDRDGRTVRIQESSRLDGPLCWIFCNDKDGRSAVMHLGQPTSIAPHLTRAQARRVAKALLKFADGKPRLGGVPRRSSTALATTRRCRWD